MSKVIVISSGKGGVGKTTTTANLGIGLAKKGKDVVLIDGDIGLRNLDLLLGLENRIIYDLVEVIEGKCSLTQALIRNKKFKNLSFLPASQRKDKNAIKEKDMVKICNKLKEQFEYILIDCPAGIENGFKNSIAAADEAIVVVNPEVSSVRDSDKIISLLEAEKNIKEPKLIINRAQKELMKKKQMMSVENILEILAIELIGIIPEDNAIIEASNTGTPVILLENKKSSKAYQNAVNRLLGEKIDYVFDNKDNWIEKIKKFINYRRK